MLHAGKVRQLSPRRADGGSKGEAGELAGSAPARDHAIAELAARQRGIVTRTQLAAVGVTTSAIDHRLRSGRLHSLYRGVYLVGHAVPPPGARELGAVLAVGSGAVLSHRSAAGWWRLRPAEPTLVDVTVCGRRCDSKLGIRVHRVSHFDPRDVRKLGGVPVTSLARTILDLAATIRARDLEQAVAEAHARRLTSRSDLLAVLARAGRRPGVVALRRVIDADESPALTRSEAEQRFLELVRSAGLPLPDVNIRVLGRYEVDFLWREQRLVVEIDGFAYHGSRAAFERDRLRDADLVAAGYRVVRVTWRQLVGAREAVVARVAGALAAA